MKRYLRKRKRRLNMIVGKSLGINKYVPLTERYKEIGGTEKPFYWLFEFPDVDCREAVDNNSMRFIKNDITGETAAIVANGTQEIITLCRCTRGWGEIQDEVGKAIPWDATSEKTIKQCLSRVDDALLREFYNHLRGRDDLNADLEARGKALCEKAQAEKDAAQPVTTTNHVEKAAPSLVVVAK